MWLANLDPTTGSEVRKTRPCLIVSPDGMNIHLRTVTAMPLTSGSRAAPFRIATRFAGREGFLLADQLRTIDKIRLRKRLGTIDDSTLTATLTILREMFMP